MDRVRRPWGRNNETVCCYAVTLDALLLDRPQYTEEDVFRPSMYSITIPHLPKTVFSYNEDVLKEAIKHFQHPYGRVAYVENVRNNLFLLIVGL